MEQNKKRIVIDREELLDELEAMSNANTLVSHIFGRNNVHLFRQMLDVVIEAVENMTAHEIGE